MGQQPEPRPGQHHQVNGYGVVGLSQGDIEAIPAFDYRAADGGGSGPSSSSSAEECAVCISVLRDGETVRRLPACGHAFHARCINGWLRGHATCPICRAGIKVVAGDDGEPEGASIHRQRGMPLPLAHSPAHTVAAVMTCLSPDRMRRDATWRATIDDESPDDRGRAY